MNDDPQAEAEEQEDIQSPFWQGKVLVPMMLGGCLVFAGIMIIGTLLAARFVTPILEARDKKEVRKMSSQDSVGTPSTAPPAGSPSNP